MSKEIKGVFVYGVYKNNVKILGNSDDNLVWSLNYSLLSDDYDIYEFDKLPCLENIRDDYDDCLDDDEERFDELPLKKQIDEIIDHEDDEVCFCKYFDTIEEAQAFCKEIENDTKEFNEEFDRRLDNDEIEFVTYSYNDCGGVKSIYRIVYEEEE